MNRGITSTAALQKIAEIGNTEEIQLMLENGADIEAQDPGADGRTPLITAAWHFVNLETVLLLIHAGADIHARDSKGLTALDCAYRQSTYRDMGVLIRVLEGAGAGRGDSGQQT